MTQKRHDPFAQIYIYSLIDPFTNEVRYIGKSINLKERLASHCNEQGVAWRHHWIQSVIQKGGRPIIGILEVLQYTDDWKTAERKWIAKFKADGARLTNSTSGGEGVPDLPPETRAKMALVWKGRKHSFKTKCLISDSLLAIERTHTQEYKDMMTRIMTDRVITWGAKISRALEKLTEDQVRDIKRRLERHENQYRLAEEFLVHQGTISNIKRGISYAWVTLEKED